MSIETTFGCCVFQWPIIYVQYNTQFVPLDWRVAWYTWHMAQSLDSTKRHNDDHSYSA